MIFYKLDYPVEKTLKNDLIHEQKVLKNFVGQEFEQAEAKYVWDSVLEHKWYVSESLKRDIGLRVAAVDYVENVYKPRNSKSNSQKSKNFIFLIFILFFFLYFINLSYLAFV
jgi:ABC-type Na+ efflux pump permease subunit